MKLSRISSYLLAFSLVAALSACGGGGGGGSVTPPGGGGGGTPPPGSSSTPSPTPAPTATPTATPTPGSVAVSSTDYDAYDGPIWGTDNWQKNGVTAPDPGDGDIVANVGSGKSTDGLSACAMGSEQSQGSGNYHVHSFLGIYVNGQAFAIPDAIGMQNPSNDEPVTNFTCAYNIHTHSASGIIHVEDPTHPGSTSASSLPQFNLQTLFDIWGQSLSSVAGASGMPTIYVGTPSGKDAAGRDLVNSYTVYTGSASGLLLSHHEAIFLVYGSLPTSTNGTPCPAGSNGCLPQVSFGISN